MILKPNNDILYYLKKVANKKKITVEKLINDILSEWSNDLDEGNFNKTKVKEDESELLDGEDLSFTSLKTLLMLTQNSFDKHGDVLIQNDEKVTYKTIG